MGAITPKCWGGTETVHIDTHLQMHRITFEAGGVCSEHLHVYRHNLFYVISGKLLIRCWNRYDLLLKTVLKAHESLSVPPGVKHQFEGLESGVALEVYWTDGARVAGEDIHRFTQGFVR